jgi:hypothetical protein
MHYIPGLENISIDELTDDKIHKKITELNKRLGIAHRFGSHEAIEQLTRLVDFYNTILVDRAQAQEQEMIDNDPKLGRTVIDIDWPDPADDKDDDEY